MNSTDADIDVIHEAVDVAQELTRLAERIRLDGFTTYAMSVDALAARLIRVLAAQERSHRYPPSTAGQRILDLLAGRSDRHPTPAYLLGLVVEAGIADSLAARDEIDRLWHNGWLEPFTVDDITFVALEGECPKLEDLPKADDEIVLETSAGEWTPRCSTEVGR